MLAALLAPGLAGAAAPPFWFLPLQRVPLGDAHARISGHNVVWQNGSGSAAEIWFRNDQRFFPLTADVFADELPEIDGTTVVWQHNDGNDYEIMRYDGISNQFVTNNATSDLCPVTGGSFIGWQGTGAAGPDFFVTPPSPPSQVTGDAAVDECPLMSATGNAVWAKVNGPVSQIWANYETLLIPGLYQIDTSSTEESSPAISGDQIVYVVGTGSAADIDLFDPNLGYSVPLITDGAEDRNPQISGNHVVWEHFDGSDWEIYEVVGGAPPQALTNNAVKDHDPRVSGNNAVWVSDEVGGSDIWVSWHGTAAQRLTNYHATGTRSASLPAIDGDLIAFQACDGSGCDIVLAPEPAAYALAAAAFGVLAALSGLARRG